MQVVLYTSGTLRAISDVLGLPRRRCRVSGDVGLSAFVTMHGERKFFSTSTKNIAYKSSFEVDTNNEAGRGACSSLPIGAVDVALTEISDLRWSPPVCDGDDQIQRMNHAGYVARANIRLMQKEKAAPFHS